MNEIVFVTTNKGKIATAQRHFKNIKLITYDYDLIEPRSDDIKEIAKSKVLQAYKLVNQPCFALDSGFFIEALYGFPKAYVNFALDTLGIEGILRAMQGIENRCCRFKECLAYYDGKKIEYFYGDYPGILTEEIRGTLRLEQWSDLWYVFMLNNANKTLAEMDLDEREKAMSVCTNAIKEFADWTA